MESEDKRHIQRIYGRVSISLVGLASLTACRSQADPRVMDASAPPPPSAVPSAVPSVAPSTTPSAANTVVSDEWERRSEPYVGMRVALRPTERKVVVTRSSIVDSAGKNKAQLECQRSLWKPGEVLVTDYDGVRGTIIVRDWGLSGGVCRHQDTKASATFIYEERDNLIVSVTRGKSMVNQEWSRVR